MQVVTYRDMLLARRWLVVTGEKLPASGWTHPRLKRPDGKPIRIAQSTRAGGVRCTATTPVSWLDYAEAAAIAAGGGYKGATDWLPAYVHVEGMDDQFLDADYHHCAGGNTLAEFAAWRDRILASIQALPVNSVARGGRSMSGDGMHILFRIAQEDMGKRYPKVIMPCKCGKAGCEDGGKVENWIGKGNRYRIQAHPFPDDMLDEPLPLLTWDMLAGIEEFAAEYNRAELGGELPPGPEWSKSAMGAAYRILLHVSDAGMQTLTDLSADEGGYFFAGRQGWEEFGAPSSAGSLNLLHDAGASAIDRLAGENVSARVVKDFAGYVAGQQVTRNLPETQRQIMAIVRGDAWQSAQSVSHTARMEFNADAGRYLRTHEGFHDLMDGGRVLSSGEVIDAMLTADAPAIVHLSERRYSEPQRKAAVNLTDALVLDAWGVNKFQTLLWHSQRRKGSLFVIGGRNTGKGLLMDMLARLGFAEIFAWAYPGCPNGYTAPAFDAVAYARTRRRLVAMDELTGSRAFGETDVPSDERIPNSGEMKLLQGRTTALIERKHQDAETRAITAGVAMISNAPPCIPALSDVYQATTTNYIGAPRRVEALAAGGLSAASDVLETAPALNRLSELLLEHMPQVANLDYPPLTEAMYEEQESLMKACHAVHVVMDARKKKAAARKASE